MFGTQFYPTPKSFSDIMLSQLKRRLSAYRRILDPNGGKGDLLLNFKEHVKEYQNIRPEFIAIEIDPDLQTVLLGRGISVIDSDFLTYNAFDHFDLILMNPPFLHGEKHLLKALEVMRDGEIVCVLNADTLRKPFSNTRSLLARKLNELGATVTYHQHAFAEAENKTNVEVALVHIEVKEGDTSTVKADFFNGLTDAELVDCSGEPGRGSEILLRNSLEAMVQSYNLKRAAALNLIEAAYNSYVPRFMSVKVGYDGHWGGGKTDAINTMLKDLRKDYWRDAIQMDRVRKYMTEKGIEAFMRKIEERSMMDFTMNNLIRLMENLSQNYSDMLSVTIVDIFSAMSREHAFDKTLHNGNVHYFNGWKTNNAFKVGHRVVQPMQMYCSLWNQLETNVQGTKGFRRLEDIEKVLAFFSARQPQEALYLTLERAFKDGQSREIECTYFMVSFFKKGTVHITFTDSDALHRFNIFVCANKGWLPHDYGKKSYKDLTPEYKEVVDSFEGEKSYSEGREGYLALVAGEACPAPSIKSEPDKVARLNGHPVHQVDLVEG